jgi:hypothetical protein
MRSSDLKTQCGVCSERLAPGEEWQTPLYGVARTQFARAADVLELDSELRVRLLEPRRALVVRQRRPCRR